MKTSIYLAILTGAAVLFPPAAGAARPCPVVVAGEWKLAVDARSFAIEPPETKSVVDERYESLPVFNPRRHGWGQGERLCGVRAFETSVRFALDEASVKIRAADGGRVLQRGVDWEMNGEWGAIGWLSREKDCGPALVSYSYRVRRLDAIVRRADGSVACLKGAGHVANPAMPPLAPGDTLLAAVYVDAQSVRLTDENLFPVQAGTANPFLAVRHAGLSKTLAKLRAGGKVKILAWGDSVTDAFWLERGERWQEQFVAWLGREYPGADIELVSNGWPGKKSASFLREGPESPRNFEKSVLEVRPDLVISEFVNDASGGAGIVEEIYAGKILPAFRERGMEWVILAPHYVRPDMMGLRGQKNCDDDPRPFVHALRAFALREGVALADASRLWGALWRRGIPYQTHLVNDINHPDAFGMALFVEALKPFFAKETTQTP